MPSARLAVIPAPHGGTRRQPRRPWRVERESPHAERFLKIAEAEAPFDAVAIIAQFPIRNLRLKTLRLLVRERVPPRQGRIPSRRKSQSCPGPRMTAGE
jgi:hypothetical protein